MKILDCSIFANDWNDSKHASDGAWSEEINWKAAMDDGYSHCIINNELWAISKHGPMRGIGTITVYDNKRSAY